MKTALILPGGGFRGILQAGMIKALLESKIQIDEIHATSIGAINGAFLAAGKFDQALELWMTIRTKYVYTEHPWRAFTEKACFFDNSRMLQLLESRLPPDKLPDNYFFTYATRLSDWQGMQFEGSDAQRTVLASASAPLAFHPATVYTSQHVIALIDGGITNSYPVRQAVARRADRLIILQPTVADPKPIHNIIDMLEVVLEAPALAALENELKFVEVINEIRLNEDSGKICEHYRHIEVIQVKPPAPTGLPLLDFDYGKDRRATLIQDGYDLAKAALEGVK